MNQGKPCSPALKDNGQLNGQLKQVKKPETLDASVFEAF